MLFRSVTLDGQDSSFLEWVGAVAPSLAKPGGAMHEVAATSLIATLLVGRSESGLCLRLTGDRLRRHLDAGATLAVVIAGSEVRVVSIEPRWISVGAVVEIEVPWSAFPVSAAADLEFAIQVRGADASILESVPQGRFLSISQPGRPADWSA